MTGGVSVNAELLTQTRVFIGCIYHHCNYSALLLVDSDVILLNADWLMKVNFSSLEDYRRREL